MAEWADRLLGNGVVVHTVFSDIEDGDLAVGLPAETLERRRRSLAPTPWTWLRQVHGAEVVSVSTAGEAAGESADASISDVPEVVLAVAVADCAPVLMWAPHTEGAVVAAAHAGWRGVLGGVLGATVRAMTRAGADPAEVSWSIGPCICPAHYEFHGPVRDELKRLYGPGVAAVTPAGEPALDLRAAVAGALAAEGIRCGPVGDPPVCTFESSRHWSHRRDATTARQVGAIRWERP